KLSESSQSARVIWSLIRSMAASYLFWRKTERPGVHSGKNILARRASAAPQAQASDPREKVARGRPFPSSRR
ncbi:MAG TPA: hypothetical protein VGA75_13275, partial [Paracoccaceae bacterium]